MSNRKKMGMFDHAKYSKPVLRSITEPVQRAVKRDINKLLDYGAAAVRFRQPPAEMSLDVSVVEDSMEQQLREEEEEEGQARIDKHYRRKKFCPEAADLDKPPIIWGSTFHPPEKPLGLGRDPSFAAVREALLKAAPARVRESPKMAAEERLALLLNPGGPHAQQCTPIRRCSDLMVPERPLLPNKCPLDQLAGRLMDSFPSITLKNTEPLTLIDATFSMAKKALLAAQERDSMEANGARGDCSAVAPTVVLNPLKSISDQTVCFFRTADAETDFLEDNLRDISMEESPTADLFDCDPIRDTQQYGDHSSHWIWSRSVKTPTGEALTSHFAETLLHSPPVPESLFCSPAVSRAHYAFDSPF